MANLTDMAASGNLVVKNNRMIRADTPKPPSSPQTPNRRVENSKITPIPVKAKDGRRLPPHNLEAEASLLGAMLLSHDAIATVMAVIDDAEHFYRPAHAQVFRVIHELYGSGESIDPVIVHEHLERTNPEMAAAVGGLDGLIGMQMNTPATSNAQSYAQIVRDNFLLRHLIKAAGEIAEIGYSRPNSVSEVVDWAENRMYQIAHWQTSSSVSPLNKILDRALTRLEELYSSKQDVTGTPTGYKDIDKLLAGLQARSFYVIGARPSMGKTAFALGMAYHAAIRKKLPVLMFSLEMGGMEIANRLISAAVKIDSSIMRTGYMKPHQWKQIVDSMSELGDSPLYVDDNPAVTIMDIRARARRLASKVGQLSMVVVDYLQLMTTTQRHRQENRQIEIAEISRGLKILARELDCPVVAISQLSRNLEMRQNKRPILSDLRESGAIEQDADVVMFIYRDQVYNTESDAGDTAEIIVAKNRNGPIGTRELTFLPQFACFVDCDRFHDDYA
ncbi:MAG: replicative DNA helicase [Acidimicrobiaceae bacterium]|nr:replicative DNA helicase [Acidimicrobiaceae bacterium]